MRLDFSKWPNKVGNFLLSPVNGNRSSFSKVVSSCVEYRTMDKVQKASDSKFLSQSSPAIG
jgi:hypothetical protein